MKTPAHPTRPAASGLFALFPALAFTLFLGLASALPSDARADFEKIQDLDGVLPFIDKFLGTPPKWEDAFRCGDKATYLEENTVQYDCNDWICAISSQGLSETIERNVKTCGPDEAVIRSDLWPAETVSRARFEADASNLVRHAFRRFAGGTGLDGQLSVTRAKPATYQLGTEQIPSYLIEGHLKSSAGAGFFFSVQVGKGLPAIAQILEVRTMVKVLGGGETLYKLTGYSRAP